MVALLRSLAGHHGEISNRKNSPFIIKNQLRMKIVADPHIHRTFPTHDHSRVELIDNIF
jgi:hypothetical protein